MSVFWALSWTHCTASPKLSSVDTRTGKAAFQAADIGDWSKADRFAERISDPVAKTLMLWVNITQADSDKSFQDIVNFINKHPNWPNQALLRQRAEEAITAATPISTVLDWFDRHPPLTVTGKMRLGEALLARGKTEEGQAVLRQAWVNGTFSQSAEESFLENCEYLLRPEDHVQRLDRLLWDGRTAEARRMYAKVGPDHQALADARIQLRSLASDPDTAIVRVPEKLRQDPGLLYERLHWARLNGRDLEARNLLAAHPVDTARLDLWWEERSILARRILNDGFASEAYRIAREHGLTESANFADAEWLAGWIALRFLSEANAALSHFKTLFRSVKLPVSRARGAYWAARAAQASGQPGEADAWYRAAAQHPTTYYGQLAAAQLEPRRGLRLPPDPRPSAAETAAFENHELVRAVRMLTAFGQGDRLRAFVLKLGELQESAGWQALIAALTENLERPDLAVAVAKQALRNGRPLIGSGYPSIRLPSAAPLLPYPVEAPLVLAIVRQESAFDSKAVSPAGARGLMQLIPSTARHIASELNLRFSQQNLMDPNYNLKLGQSYISSLLAAFDGSYVLALAAYNAGPTRVREWLLDSGDQRESVTNAIDWIEAIPFAETRNYVQRTLENLQVYRVKLSRTEVASTLEGDLKR